MLLKERIINYLKSYLHTLIDNNDFSTLENIANFANALESGQWEKLPDDEKLFWLIRFSSTYGHIISDGGIKDSNLNKCLEIVAFEIKGLKKKT